MNPPVQNSVIVEHLDSHTAKNIDDELVKTGYSLDQLMELAGRSVADGVVEILAAKLALLDNYNVYNVLPMVSSQQKIFASESLLSGQRNPMVGILVGPGNNGGDGRTEHSAVEFYSWLG